MGASKRGKCYNVGKLVFPKFLRSDSRFYQEPDNRVDGFPKNHLILAQHRS